MNEKLGKCKTCNDPVSIPGAKLCNGCWEVEHRLEEYAKSTNGRRKLVQILEDRFYTCILSGHRREI